MNYSAYRLIFEYYVNTASEKADISNFSEELLESEDVIRLLMYLNTKPSNFIKVFNTITAFHLTIVECKNIINSGIVRLVDEGYSDYKNRLKTRQDFGKYSKYIYEVLEGTKINTGVKNV